MTDYTYEQILSDDGQHRARIVLDMDGAAFKPDGCFFGTVYRMETDYYRTRTDILGQDSCVGTDLSDELSSLWDLFRDMKMIEAVLRGDLNVCRMCEKTIDQYGHDEAAEDVCDPEQEGAFHEAQYDFHDSPIVGFDYIERDYGKMVNVVTLADLKHWGFESVGEYHTQTGNDDPSHGNLVEWEAWADGEVYYVVIERKLSRNSQLYFGSDLIREENDQAEWEQIDSLSGLYGTEYAEQWAREQLADLSDEMVGN